MAGTLSTPAADLIADVDAAPLLDPGLAHLLVTTFPPNTTGPPLTPSPQPSDVQQNDSCDRSSKGSSNWMADNVDTSVQAQWGEIVAMAHLQHLSPEALSALYPSCGDTPAAAHKTALHPSCDDTPAATHNNNNNNNDNNSNLSGPLPARQPQTPIPFVRPLPVFIRRVQSAGRASASTAAAAAWAVAGGEAAAAGSRAADNSGKHGSSSSSSRNGGSQGLAGTAAGSGRMDVADGSTTPCPDFRRQALSTSEIAAFRSGQGVGRSDAASPPKPRRRRFSWHALLSTFGAGTSSGGGGGSGRASSGRPNSGSSSLTAAASSPCPATPDRDDTGAHVDTGDVGAGGSRFVRHGAKQVLVTRDCKFAAQPPSLATVKEDWDDYII